MGLAAGPAGQDAPAPGAIPEDSHPATGPGLRIPGAGEEERKLRDMFRARQRLPGIPETTGGRIGTAGGGRQFCRQGWESAGKAPGLSLLYDRTAEGPGDHLWQTGICDGYPAGDEYR